MDHLGGFVRFFDVLEADLDIHGTCRLQLASVCADKADVKKSYIRKILHIGIDLIGSLLDIPVVSLVIGEDLFDTDPGICGKSCILIKSNGHDIIGTFSLQGNRPFHSIFSSRFFSGGLCRISNILRSRVGDGLFLDSCVNCLCFLCNFFGFFHCRISCFLCLDSV